MIDSSEKLERVREKINASGHPKEAEAVAGLWHRVALRIMSEYTELQELSAAYRKQFDASGDTACYGGNNS
jgi:hypothetical protein